MFFNVYKCEGEVVLEDQHGALYTLKRAEDQEVNQEDMEFLATFDFPYKVRR